MVTAQFSRNAGPSVEAWATTITQAWQETVHGIIEVGRLLIEARKALNEQRGAWSRLIGDNEHKSQLPFSAATAKRLIAIADDERIRSHVNVMPSSWGTLYEITQLDDEEFKEAIETGRINPEMERSDVRPRSRGQTREERSALNDDYLTPDEADRAIKSRAEYLWGASFNPPPGIRSCLKEAMQRASPDDVKVIAAAAVFLTELKDAANE